MLLILQAARRLSMNVTQPDFVYDVIGSGGSEVIGSFIKDGLNTDSESKKKSE